MGRKPKKTETEKLEKVREASRNLAEAAAGVLRAGRGADQFIVRLPAGMRDAIKSLADQNNRSMNAEISFALAVHLAQWRVGPASEELRIRLEHRMKEPDVPDPELMRSIARYLELLANPKMMERIGFVLPHPEKGKS